MLPADERRAYVALALIPGIGPARLNNVRQVFGSYRGALAAPFALLCTVPAMSRAAATAVANRDPDVLDRVDQALDRVSGRILTPFDPDFPRSLTTIEDPPVLLFAQGRLELFERPTIAIVGSRHPTPYGVDVTRSAAGAAAGAGITVVSGMARGLDAVAHWAAVDRPGGTIGVLGNGLGVVYPAANRTLYSRVAAEGLLVTEHSPGERPNAGSFQRRNRLIAGLARATLVVEGGEKSGALITAGAAIDQGRDVLVVPGQITSRLSMGTNAWLRDGATPYLEPADLWRLFPEVAAPKDQPARSIASQQPRRVLEVLDGVPRTVDDLADELGLPPGEVAGALTELEVVGLADRGPAGFTRSA